MRMEKKPANQIGIIINQERPFLCSHFFLVFQIGDIANCFYIILNGVVKVKIRETYGEPLKTVGSISTGKPFGELALVKDTHR